MLLDPADAVFVNLLGFFGQHDILEVGPVEAHREPGKHTQGFPTAACNTVRQLDWWLGQDRAL